MAHGRDRPLIRVELPHLPEVEQSLVQATELDQECAEAPVFRRVLRVQIDRRFEGSDRVL